MCDWTRGGATLKAGRAVRRILYSPALASDARGE